MPRCVPLPPRRGLMALLGAVAFGSAFPATAQSPAARPFPATALRGELVVTLPPDVLLNQRAARLAPGARIRGPNNLLLLSGALAGQRMAVHYTLDGMGQLLDVWVLTPAELARRPWPATPEQANSWQFNADAQTWSPR